MTKQDGFDTGQIVGVAWEERAAQGYLRTFFQTAWQATFRTRLFCQAVAHPVCYVSARRFQAVVITLLMVPWLGMMAIGVSYIRVAGEASWGMIPFWAMVLAAAVGSLFFLVVMTGVHTYWLHPRHESVEGQNRAIALGYYACAALVPAAGGLAMLLTLLLISPFFPVKPTSILAWVLIGTVLVSAGGVLISGIAFWLTVCEMPARLVACRGWRQLLLNLGFPVLAAVLWILLPVGLPGLIFYLLLVCQGLQAA